MLLPIERVWLSTNSRMLRSKDELHGSLIDVQIDENKIKKKRVDQITILDYI